VHEAFRPFCAFGTFVVRPFDLANSHPTQRGILAKSVILSVMIFGPFLRLAQGCQKRYNSIVDSSAFLNRRAFAERGGLFL
jgi:hypothetical protein